PLAIELAAARVRVFSPAQIAAGLGERFRMLTGGVRTAMPRQQTLRASVDWSFDLLTSPERILLRRLGVFVGSFTLAAAELVGAGGELESHHVLDQLALLVEKSLVQANPSGDEARYTLLETIREYALARLGESADEAAARDRHLDLQVSLVATSRR